MPKIPNNEDQVWALVYGLAMSIGLFGMGKAATGFEEKFAERLDLQSRMIADRALLTLKQRKVI